MTLSTEPIARAQMLIRRPVSEVFEAFVDPALTSRFWFTRGSGRLEPGASVNWHWEMYGVGADVVVRALEPGRRILIEWPNPVEWVFSPRGDDATFVTITESGFTGTVDEKVALAIDSMGGLHPRARRVQGFPGARHRVEPRRRPQPRRPRRRRLTAREARRELSPRASRRFAAPGVRSRRDPSTSRAAGGPITQGPFRFSGRPAAKSPGNSPSSRAPRSFASGIRAGTSGRSVRSAAAPRVHGARPRRVHTASRVHPTSVPIRSTMCTTAPSRSIPVERRPTSEASERRWAHPSRR